MRRSVLVTGLLLTGAGCHRDDFELTLAVVEEAPTVIRASWTTDAPGVSWVEYGTDKDRVHVTPTTTAETTEHAVLIYGAPALSDVYVEAFTDTGGGIRSGRGVAETGGLPSAIPGLKVTRWQEGETSPEPYFLAAMFGGVGCAFVMDRAGNWLWWNVQEGDVQVVETEFLQGTNDVVYNSFLTDHSVDAGYLHVRSLDLSVQEDLRTELAHHAFTQLPDGGLAYVYADLRTWFDPELGEEGAEVQVVGDAIKVIPAEGEPYDLFSTWDIWEPWKTEHWDGNFYPQGYDWSHANALTYVPHNDTLLLSFRNLDLFLELDRETGEVLRQFGGPGGYGFAEGSRRFEYQHDPNWTPWGTLVMTHTVEETIAIEYSVDDENQLLTEVWSHGDGRGIYTLAQGTVSALMNGNRLVNFGSAGILHEVTPEGRVVWEVKARLGAGFGSLTPFGDWYPGE